MCLDLRGSRRARAVIPSCPVTRAADVGKEIATAAQHAGYAADSTAIGMAHAHLHHTINCLVGPRGDGFDAKELNPCKDFGNGAIPDSGDATKVTSLRAALGLAEAGLKSDDLDTAKKLGAQDQEGRMTSRSG